jgi:heme/copper-type cytochrome/quinol oxidase subunit 3
MSQAIQHPVPESDLPLEFSKEQESLKITGFWMFLVTDLLIFGSLFAVYAVYQSRLAAGPGPGQLFQMGPVLLETMLLLTSSFTVGLAVLAMRRGQVRALTAWLVVTLLLGAGFVVNELRDFATYIAAGAGWHVRACLSAFFFLVSTHGFHVTFGILWALTLLVQLSRRGLTPVTARKLFTFSLYWHFLDIVWIFIFSYVYLGGHIGL